MKYIAYPQYFKVTPQNVITILFPISIDRMHMTIKSNLLCLPFWHPNWIVYHNLCQFIQIVIDLIEKLTHRLYTTRSFVSKNVGRFWMSLFLVVYFCSNRLMIAQHAKAQNAPRAELNKSKFGHTVCRFQLSLRPFWMDLKCKLGLCEASCHATNIRWPLYFIFVWLCFISTRDTLIALIGIPL